MRSKEPRLTPRPANTIGIPHANPMIKNNILNGRKILRGLNNIDIFNMFTTVSKAVDKFIVLLPPCRLLICIGYSKTLHFWFIKKSVIISLKDIVSGQMGANNFTSSVQ